jgi:hypothetical protein
MYVTVQKLAFSIIIYIYIENASINIYIYAISVPTAHNIVLQHNVALVNDLICRGSPVPVMLYKRTYIFQISAC